MTQANIIKVGDLAPGANLDAYKQTVNSFAILTAEEERGLAEQLYYQQDLESARRLVMSHLRFVIHIARSYSGYGLAQSDLIQEGNVGLMKAVRRFNPEVGVRLVSFAVHWIKAEIHEYVLRNWRIVKVATTKAQRKLFFNLRSAKKNLNWFNANEVEAVAADLGVKPETVRQMEGRLSAHDMSFDLPVNDDEPAWGAPAHYLEDSASDPADIIESQDFERNAQEQFSAALADLDERSRDILGQRWLTDKKATLHQLAAQYGVSAERIRQLEKNAINKLKAVIQA